MVENKHSINTILSFGAKSVNPEILEQLLTGRADIADFFEQKIRAIVEEKTNQFWLIVGQRGMGKTHLLKVLHSRIWHYVEENRLVIAYFAEEEYGVANFFDFLLRILNSFIKWYDKDSEFLKNELEKLQNLPTNKQTLYLENIIKDYMKEKPLLILTENFGDILEQMGENEQGRLRAWLYDNNKVSIIATSQSVSDNFDKEDRPFYGFFVNYYLKNLSFEESLSFLISLAKLDKDEKLIEHLNGKGKAQVRAIYDLVKGNHRLLVTFYQFLKTDTVAKVSENFIKTINDLKPYYETYIRYLPPQQQKILRYIALARKPQKGVEISKNCFIEQKSLSKQLSELTKKNLLDANEDPSDKRNKFYDISEPLLRISIEVGEHKEGITALFIDFLALYYNFDELLTRNQRFLKLLNSCNEKDSKNIKYEIEAINKALVIKKNSIREKISKISYLIKNQEYNKAKENFFSEVIENESDFYLMTSMYLNFFQRFDKAINYSRKVNLTKLKFFNDKIVINDYYKKLSNSLMNKFVQNKDADYLNEVLLITENELKNKEILLDDFIFARILKGTLLIEKKKEDEAKDVIKSIINLNFNSYPNNYKYLIQEIVTYLWKGDEKNFTGKYINYVKNLEINERIKLYEELSIGSYYNTFVSFNKIIQKDISKIDLKQIITNWVTNILIKSENLDDKDLEFLNNFIENNKNKIPELTISEIYINTYREVVLNKNKSALYELPKEQREFFEKNILKRKK